MNKDQKINQLAIEVANGVEGAYEKFYEEVDPLLKKLAQKRYSVIEKEDVVQEFHTEAFLLCEKYRDNYEGNFMAICNTVCINALKELNRVAEGGGTLKRGSQYKDRKISFQAQIGEDGDSTLSEIVGDRNQVSVEEQVIGRLSKEELKTVVTQLLNEFKESTSEKNYEVTNAIYKGASNLDIAQITNRYAKKPQPINEVSYNDSARQAVSRAKKAFRKFLEDRQGDTVVIQSKLF